MRYWQKLLVFLGLILILSCTQLKNEKGLFELDPDLSLDQILNENYQKVPVDINMFEKKISDSVSLYLTFDNNLEQLESKSWIFYIHRGHIEEDKMITLFNQSGFSFITPICKSDSKYSFFSVIDKSNRMFAGRKVMEDTLMHFELTYYYPH
jgi:hypothetical protein